MKLADIISVIESTAPLAYQEDYDNSGLTVGDVHMEVTGALLCIDVIPEVIEEAVNLGINLIISHHPVIFSPIKRLTGNTLAEKTVILAVKNNIALYCAHTNLDNVFQGVNQKIAQKLELQHARILNPVKNRLNKLVTFVPKAHANTVRMALFSAGAGNIGRYDACSFNSEGRGSFRAQEGTSPFVGKIGELHFEEEVRIETIFPAWLKHTIIEALVNAHPYEEVAYDIYPVANSFDRVGSGLIGELSEPVDEKAFLLHVKEVFNCYVVKHSQLLHKPMKKVAVCGGSGSFLMQSAMAAGADVFLTGEIKYHDFFTANKKMVLVDIGHYESEQFTNELFYDILIKKLPNFAIHFSTINTSPIYYL